MRIRLDDVPEVAEPRNSVVVRKLVSGEKHGDDISVTWVRLNGRHRRLRTDHSTRVYYVLEGSASFQLGGEPEFELGAGETLVIPRGVPYEFFGEMIYLVMNGPGFREGDDMYEEE